MISNRCRVLALLAATLSAGLPASLSAAAPACSSAWSAAYVYTGGQTASYSSINYKANWWTQGQNPSTNNGVSGTGQPWTVAGACGSSSTPDPAPTPAPTSGSCNTAWSPSAVYTGGQTASYANINYTANWWTEGQIPSSNSGPSGSGQPWTATGSCGSAPIPTPNPAPTPTPVPSPGTRVFAPYVDMSLTPDEQLLTMQQQAGLKAVTMAFLVAGSSGCSVSWGGLGGTITTDTLADGQSIQIIVQSLQSSGIPVIISFGGALGQEPAQVCSSVSQLQAIYQSVITRYNVSALDFDIEGAAVTDTASVTRRDLALKALKIANPQLVISYTLPVLPTGLVSTGVNILNSVKTDGLALDVVNIMTMDYGAAVDNGGQMGLDATQAAAATESQLVTAGLTGTTIGITPMIGVNDTNTEVFKLTDAQMLLNFAASNNYVTRLAMWSLARDNGSCPAQAWASPTCSGIAQSTYAFSNVLGQLQ